LGAIFGLALQHAAFVDGHLQHLGPDLLLGGGRPNNGLGFRAGGEFGTEKLDGAWDALPDFAGFKRAACAVFATAVCGGFGSATAPVNFTARWFFPAWLSS